MARIVSFVVLFVMMLLIFGLFFRVMVDFLVPMFLAVLLVIIFRPVHEWFLKKCKTHDRIAAMLTTGVVMLVFFVPAAYLLYRAALEGGNFYRVAMDDYAKAAKREDSPLNQPEKIENSDDKTREAVQWWATEKINDLSMKVGWKIEPETLNAVCGKVGPYLTPLALNAGQFLWQCVMGFCIMILSLYYFLADGPAMIRAVMRLSPLDNKYEDQLIAQFGSVTRAVVVATLASAVVQGLLAGAGFYFAGANSVFLLTALAMLFAIIPFIGSAGIWVPVCLWMYFVDGRTWPAIILAIYCGVVVSAVDNVIKPLVLHGKSNLHPLFALLSVLGGVQALGPIGIIVGPMVVAFMQTILEMVNKEMMAISKAEGGR
jgi:predicted PurR-regulated permease PerM